MAGETPVPPARHAVEGGWTGGRQTAGFEDRAVSKTKSDGEASFGHRGPKERILRWGWGVAAGGCQLPLPAPFPWLRLWRVLGSLIS